MDAPAIFRHVSPSARCKISTARSVCAYHAAFFVGRLFFQRGSGILHFSGILKALG